MRYNFANDFRIQQTGQPIIPGMQVFIFLLLIDLGLKAIRKLRLNLLLWLLFDASADVNIITNRFTFILSTGLTTHRVQYSRRGYR